MAPPLFPASTNGQDDAPPKTYYEQQREMLVTEIAQVCYDLSQTHYCCMPHRPAIFDAVADSSPRV